ncbi:receptor-like protein EIX2 [Cryptomeria japonica]|uniref:receptor-like protein EIX2 n=1 Tax=Cryptomeria japonica TaxID=3369 RepID=UPI0027DA264F|nr:receptor-like protein EIX2 [Cryptomeria japonica]
MAVAPIHLAFISAFLIILFTSPCIGLFICPSQESQALLFFKEVLKVSDGILSSWDNRSDCCSTWERISCNYATGHVELVNLTAYTNHTEQGLQSGVISSSLCSLPFLKYLILKSIGLTGNIPSCLGNLSYLQVLVLKNNSLTGIVPPAICLLTNLGHLDRKLAPSFQLAGLDLVSCSIGGRVPEWLFTQYSLQRLALADDNIVGEIPKWLMENNPQLFLFNISGNHFNGSLFVPSRSIRWMTVFDVSRNAFTGHVASTWPPDLQLLMVNDNSLIGNIPPGLCNLIHLEKLDLSNNKLNGSMPSCFANYKRIQVLNLGHNRLDGSIPQGVCSSSLNVRNNKLSGAFPMSIINCKILQVLDIGHNKFAGHIPWSVGNLSALKVLMMNDNSFRGSIPSEIVQLKQLQILDLSSNNISGVIPHSLGSLKAMTLPREDGHILSSQLNPFQVITKDNGVKSYSGIGPIE